ncbi:MAG: hypothetical protein U1F43_05100 [Myxococcota bacterium]
MVPAEAVPGVIADAARLVMKGEVLVVGAAALAFAVPGAPPARHVDLIVSPPVAAERVVLMMSEGGWYHKNSRAFVVVSPAETFVAPAAWSTRAQRFETPAAPGVGIVVPHPHDIIMAKVERFDPYDQDHARKVLSTLPLPRAALDALADEMPHRRGAIADPARIQRFAFNLDRLHAMRDVIA